MITFDAKSQSAIFDGSGSSSTWAHTVSAVLKNMGLIVMYAGNDPTGDRPALSVTYNGVAMTKLVEKDANPYNVSIWYLANPATGTHNVVVTRGGGTNDGVAQAVSFGNMNTINLPDVSIGGNTTGNPSLTLTTTRGQDILIDCFYSDRNSDLTIGAGQTLIYQTSVNSGSDRVVTSYKILTGAGINSMSWTGSAAYAGAVGAFQPLNSGGGFLINFM